ncbi:3-beta hydroxysteroid dehydrogenase/isomerase family protein [Stachybotrys elegans]|uniref:3-beta hydroxysteroid dehydrogenase/isomerase family protein n=1 Tax=Stachybotrys elegans TaxID=80388 RepID=A0A8K0SJI1_9HYPO|nr:3-beta hydroxysteroid dehydrogenase/isomerase family protein [Stachybotrys elegans]
MSSSLVLITGATGFIGSWVTRYALEAGHRVRLTIRRESQQEKLAALFSKHADKLEFAVVPDFTKPGAFDAALQGVDQVIHLASPMPGKGNDFKTDYVDPAVKGTLIILDAAKSVPSIKRVLVTSSILALAPFGSMAPGVPLPPLIKENSGAKYTVDVDSDIADHGSKYHGSKILAHEATKEWLAANKPGFSVLTFHPVFVIGPSLIQQSAKEIDAVNGGLLQTLRTGNIVFHHPVFVDVRDVAEAMVKAVDGPASPGQEFILHGERTTYDDVAAAAQALYPEQGFQLKAPVSGNPVVLNTETKGAENLGIKFRPFKEVLQAFIDQQLSFSD